MGAVLVGRVCSVDGRTFVETQARVMAMMQILDFVSADPSSFSVPSLHTSKLRTVSLARLAEACGMH